MLAIFDPDLMWSSGWGLDSGGCRRRCGPSRACCISERPLWVWHQDQNPGFLLPGPWKPLPDGFCPVFQLCPVGREARARSGDHVGLPVQLRISSSPAQGKTQNCRHHSHCIPGPQTRAIIGGLCHIPPARDVFLRVTQNFPVEVFCVCPTLDGCLLDSRRGVNVFPLS